MFDRSFAGYGLFFKVAAVNKGGESFPSETLSACIASKNEGTILVVNAFTRLDGPAVIDTESEQGFDLDADPGVQYGPFAGFCGRQLSFDKENIGSETKMVLVIAAVSWKVRLSWAIHLTMFLFMEEP